MLLALPPIPVSWSLNLLLIALAVRLLVGAVVMWRHSRRDEKWTKWPKPR